MDFINPSYERMRTETALLRAPHANQATREVAKQRKYLKILIIKDMEKVSWFPENIILNILLNSFMFFF